MSTYMPVCISIRAWYVGIVTRRRVYKYDRTKCKKLAKRGWKECRQGGKLREKISYECEHVLFVETRVFATEIWNVDFGAANKCKTLEGKVRWKENDRWKSDPLVDGIEYVTICRRSRDRYCCFSHWLIDDCDF